MVLTCSDGTGPPAPTVDRIVIRGPDIVRVGSTGSFSAVLLAENGDTLPLQPVTWTSTDSTVLTITRFGLARGIDTGQATISAAVQNKVATTPVVVTPMPITRIDVTPANVDSLLLGDSLQLSATIRDSVGTPVLNQTVFWASSDTFVATVSQFGLVRARGPGSFAVTARLDTLVGGVFLNSQFPVASLSLPESATVGLYHRVLLIADYRSSTGTHLAGRPVTWKNRAPNVVDLSSQGLVTPVALGQAFIVAEGFGFSDSTLVTVEPEPAVTFVFTRWTDGLPADVPFEFRAAAQDSGGRTVTGMQFTWSSSDTSVASLVVHPDSSQIAYVTGHAPGQTVITASTAGGQVSVTAAVRYGLFRFVSTPDSLMMSAGDARRLGGIGVDRLGNRLDITSHIQSMTPADTSIAVVDLSDTPPFIRGKKPGRTLIYHSLTTAGLADTVPVIVLPPAAPHVAWTSFALPLAPYDSGSAVLRITDSAGIADTTARVVQFTTSDSTVATVFPQVISDFRSADTLTVRSGHHGSAMITAIVDSQFAMLFATVGNIRPTQVQIDSAPAAGVPGDTFQLLATVRGEDGRIRPYPVSWKTSDPARATISDSGLVTISALGDFAVIATSGFASDTVTITAVSANGPVIAAVSPVPMVAGQTAVLTGSGFSDILGENSVVVDGIPVSVLAASDTALTVALPQAGAWPCRADRSVRVVIESAGRRTVDSAPLNVATALPVSVDETILLSGASAVCAALPGGSYDFILGNGDDQAGTIVAMSFDGGLPLAAPATDNLAPPAYLSGPILLPSRDSMRQVARVHRELLEQSRRMAARAGNAPALLRESRFALPQLSVTATINGTARVRIPKLEDPDFCASYRTITARVVYAGSHALILEDVNSALAGRMDSYFQILGQEFDNVMYPILTQNFGNPLALDSLTDNDGRIAMVVSPVVNSYGVGGFVVSCDFFPESVAPSSNTGEIFYTQAPTYRGSGFSQYTPDVWLWLTRAVVMHEAKHLTALAERLSRGLALEESWLEEGTAVIAEELWSRGVYGMPWRGNLSYRQTLYCDVRPTFPECTGRPFAMFNAFAFLYDNLQRYDQHTALHPMNPSDATFYGTSWALLRWAMDYHTSSESVFLKALVQEPLTGVANLSARVGRPFGDVLTEWGAALYLDAWSRPSSQPRLGFPSWYLEDVFVGMAVDFPNDFLDGGHPLRPRGLVRDYPYPLNPGSWRLFSFTTGASVLGARGTGGALASPTVRLLLRRSN
jgi:uncharacterized protein YjdB